MRRYAILRFINYASLLLNSHYLSFFYKLVFFFPHLYSQISLYFISMIFFLFDITCDIIRFCCNNLKKQIYNYLGKYPCRLVQFQQNFSITNKNFLNNSKERNRTFRHTRRVEEANFVINDSANFYSTANQPRANLPPSYTRSTCFDLAVIFVIDIMTSLSFAWRARARDRSLRRLRSGSDNVKTIRSFVATIGGGYR